MLKQEETLMKSGDFVTIKLLDNEIGIVLSTYKEVVEVITLSGSKIMANSSNFELIERTYGINN